MSLRFHNKANILKIKNLHPNISNSLSERFSKELDKDAGRHKQNALPTYFVKQLISRTAHTKPKRQDLDSQPPQIFMPIKEISGQPVSHYTLDEKIINLFLGIHPNSDQNTNCNKYPIWGDECLSAKLFSYQ